MGTMFGSYPQNQTRFSGSYPKAMAGILDSRDPLRTMPSHGTGCRGLCHSARNGAAGQQRHCVRRRDVTGISSPCGRIRVVFLFICKV
jgi:hypothetical protein